MNRARLILDPFILLLLGTVLLASIMPARGVFVPAVIALADAGIVLLFFLHGAKLSSDAIIAGASNWKLHLAVLGTTFLLFPLLGLGVASLPFFALPIASGLLFLTLLPSTVQSSIAFTAIARGNVAAAVCSASFSNLLGIVLTPLLVALTITGSARGGALSWQSIEAIALQLLLPFATGHALRRWIGGWIAKHKLLVTVVDRGSILVVVYSAFGAAVVEGIWSQLSPGLLGLISLLCVLLLSAVLGLTFILGRALGLTRADAIVLQFCGSKKSLASGVPMAGVLFSPAQVGMVILPLMLFHQIQLMACALLARHYAAQMKQDTPDV
jgi:sodium/bile acid cotransporter 7